VRIFVTLVCLLELASIAEAQTLPPSAAQTSAAQTSAAQTYAAQKKSVALAVTLEALSPIAGVGAFYAHDPDRATVLTIVSAVAAGVGVGSAFWLVHLDGQQESGVSREIQDVEQGAAISVLVTAAVVYLVARISGLALAVDATDAFNEDLRQRVGLPPPEPVVPFHALAPGPMFTLRF
jgi:hypothetical protein